jgi:hypothetical protein
MRPTMPARPQGPGDQLGLGWNRRRRPTRPATARSGRMRRPGAVAPVPGQHADRRGDRGRRRCGGDRRLGRAATEATTTVAVAAGTVAFLVVWTALFALERHALDPLRRATPRFPTPPDES